MKTLITILGLTVALASARSETVALDPSRLRATNVTSSIQRLDGSDVVKVVKSDKVTAFDEPTFVKISGLQFRDGVIEAKVLSRLASGAPDFARGFIGIAFRIDESDTRFESIYLRPTNGRAEQQKRRNSSIQYFSYPDFKFERLRKESPGEYESYSDMALDQWIIMRIEVRGKQAKLFLNGAPHPALIVNDLKLGAEASGSIGLWVDVGTEGYFKDLRVEVREPNGPPP